MKDLDEVRYYCKKLNSGEMYSLLAAILTNKSWDDIKVLLLLDQSIQSIFFQ